MTREQAIQEACEIMALAYHSIGDYSEPSDGFCHLCPSARSAEWNFTNKGHIFAYIRKAVLAQLKTDGYEISKGFDPATGKPLTTR